ncbi:MAG: YesL family protein [Firmicutes bacterium]|nr:YesL family protein [Bacillota bacterium]
MRIFDTVVLSILWILCCLPLVTIGPATAALYYTAVKCVRFREQRTYRNFFRSFRENMRTGMGYTIVFLVLSAGMFFIYMAIVGTLPLEQALTVPVIWGFLLFCVFLLSVFLCGVIFLSRFDYNLSKLLGDSFRIAFGNLPRVFGSGLIFVGLMLLSIKFYYYQVWYMTPGISILIISKLMEPVLRKYTPDIDELMKLPLDDRPWYLQ